MENTREDETIATMRRKMRKGHFYALSGLLYKTLTYKQVCSNRKNICKKYSDRNFFVFHSKMRIKKGKSESSIMCGFFVRNTHFHSAKIGI